ANDSDGNGDPLVLAGSTQPSHGTLVDNGDGTLSYTPAADYDGGDSFTYTVSDGSLGDTATVSLTVGDPIDVWYGVQQKFGDPGEAQAWINVLGTVFGDIDSLSYSLNGGPARELAVGPDTRRLQSPGDFNIDIAFSELDSTAADDIVTIFATSVSGEVFKQEVTISYESGAEWNANYNVEWGRTTDLQKSVQVIDGKWAVENGGVRPIDLGYDRLLAIGDIGWDNYEARLSLSMNDMLNIDPNGRDGGGFALGMLWNGHTDNPISGWQPKAGWEPGAAFFYTDNDADGTGKLTLHPSVNFFSTLATKTLTFQEGSSYEFLLRIEQLELFDRQYSLKVWEVGGEEPNEWALQGTQSFAAPATGSLYLNAHYFDVTFNDITVTEIVGSDIVAGRSSGDEIVAVDLANTSPGLGEIDVLVGGGGSDTFVLGAAGVCYYDDGLTETSGLNDFCLIWDFERGTDLIRLGGAASDYFLSDVPEAIEAQGTAIWKIDTGESELVGVLQDVFDVSLLDDNFIYDVMA
ncbi:MAG: cadherin-like domain-containing protein, partial [Parvularcula sp.]|nr:cadherin-like domain-containing protein [Parvularcula sp.]